jgi:hypothetical protein
MSDVATLLFVHFNFIIQFQNMFFIIISKLFGTANKYLYAAVPAKAHNSWQIVQYQSSIINTIQYSTQNSIFKEVDAHIN